MVLLFLEAGTNELAVSQYNAQMSDIKLRDVQMVGFVAHPIVHVKLLINDGTVLRDSRLNSRANISFTVFPDLQPHKHSPYSPPLFISQLGHGFPLQRSIDVKVFDRNFTELTKGVDFENIFIQLDADVYNF